MVTDQVRQLEIFFMFPYVNKEQKNQTDQYLNVDVFPNGKNCAPMTAHICFVSPNKPHIGSRMTQRRSDIVIAAASARVAREIENALIQRMQNIGLGPTARPIELSSRDSDDLRKLVRRIIGNTALRYNAGTVRLDEGDDGDN
ncbi:hypothetical protein [Burkholderia vietnamiensis]|uniref:hypothetical protein n=1 Tax=Burkholderia vietnamiensis TaxID=60552 RepID=UPI000B26E707|nr:hypothetical protein [Burkholderia vietnamiensis]